MTDRYALCVGSNYPGTDYELAGCVNDAHDWHHYLTSCDYEASVLLEPTRDQFLRAVRGLVAAAGWGDRVVLTVSGHGTWVTDLDGDESDGRDEALVFSDGIVTDDELQEVLAQLHRSAGALVLPDTCHSGTVSRFAGIDPRTEPVKVVGAPVPRFLPATRFTPELSEALAERLEARAASTPRRTANLISAAKDSEYAWDAWFTGRANGAFTRCAIDVHQDGMSLTGWHRAIAAAMQTDRFRSFPQTPQLTSSSLYRRYADAL